MNVSDIENISVTFTKYTFYECLEVFFIAFILCLFIHLVAEFLCFLICDRVSHLYMVKCVALDGFDLSVSFEKGLYKIKIDDYEGTHKKFMSAFDNACYELYKDTQCKYSFMDAIDIMRYKHRLRKEAN